MRKVILGVLVFLTIVMVGFWGIGASADVSYSGEVERDFSVSREKAWQVFEDFITIQQSRSEIVKIDVLSSDSLGPLVWKEYTDMEGYLVFERISVTPNSSFTLSMIESSFGMKGIWTYEFTQVGDSVNLRIMENSEVEDVFVRTALVLAGRDANLKQEINSIDAFLSE